MIVKANQPHNSKLSPLWRWLLTAAACAAAMAVLAAPLVGVAGADEDRRKDRPAVKREAKENAERMLKHLEGARHEKAGAHDREAEEMRKHAERRKHEEERKRHEERRREEKDKDDKE